MRAAQGRPPLDVTLIVPLLLGALLFSPLWARGLPNTADGMLHLYRSALWFDAWQQGVFWPRWHTALYFGYGYPLFNFYAPLLYAAGALLNLVLPSTEAALKCLLLLVCIGYPLGMYLWARDVIGKLPAAVAAAAFAFAPYRFRELFVQGNYAQFLAWGLAPWVLYTGRRLIMAPGRAAFAAAVASLTALLLAHNISAMLLAPAAALYLLWQAVENRAARPWPRLLAAAACALLMALAFWLPALLETRETQVGVLTQGYFRVTEHFISLSEQLAATPWMDERAANPTLPFNAGRVQLLLAAAGALLLLRPGIGRVRRGHLLFALAAAAAAGFLMLAPSLPIWEWVPFMAFAEFPTRLYGLACIPTALLAGAALGWLDGQRRAQAIAALLAVFALVLAVVNLQFPRSFLPVRASTAGLQGYEADFSAPGTTSAGEYLSRWTTTLSGEPALSREGDRIALLAPPPGMEGRVEGAGPAHLTLRVRAQRAGMAPVAHFYAPGWRATVNGAPVDLRPCTPAGLICLDLAAGESAVRLVYAGTRLQRAAAILGALGVALTALLLVVGTGRGGNAPAAHQQSRTRDARGPALALAALIAALLAVKTVWIAPRTELFRFASPPGRVLRAEQQVDLPMGPSVRLIGWDLPQTQVRQGGTLRVRLYWQAVGPLEESYSSFVQLIAGPDQREHGVTTNMYAGQIPSRLWNTDYYIVDEHVLQVEPDTPPVLYALRVGLSPHGEQARVGEQDLTPRVRVLPVAPVRLAEIPHKSDVTFAGGAALAGFDLVGRGAELALTLYWRAGPAPVTDGPLTDGQIFVHVLDAKGTLLAQADGAAGGGLYPVRDWRPGEIVKDMRRIALPAGGDAAAVLVGLYDLATGQRVPAFDGSGAALPENAVRIEANLAQASAAGD